MDFWTIGNKAGLLFYIIAVLYLGASDNTAWLTLAYLSYLSLNMAIPLFKRKHPKQLMIFLSAACVVYCAVRLDPLFIVLLPVNIYEFVSLHVRRRRYALLTMAVPALFVPQAMLPIYVLAAFLSYLLYAGNRVHMDKLKAYEDEREAMRDDLQRLSRALNENNEYIRQSEYTIKLEERNRLSQRIHDEVGHAMAGALIQMEASKRLMASDRDKASELLQNAIAISKEGLERIRLTLKNMKPRSEELGINRLRLFVDELSAKHAIDAKLTYEGNLDVITPIQWKIIQQNATEAATNTLKYGQATEIHFEVKVLNTVIKALVADNGRGAPKIVKGIGIVGMEERAASAGGTVIVDGARGFSVTTLLPYGSPK
ncbi:sensor histidine kinase [Cohnella nanjingensis]|uniref:histidine kinase n=1 Tax=Cohnella nanjingensis TaxID=1387779 RepID=A0A7X0RWM8_9BACL|nr:histidine kinase [Cohnella nanjingensis]MBB6675013.1 sensor histidine kinase [Cohnella nanjingensis]